jgi:serine/threonine-protein kinase HipA
MNDLVALLNGKEVGIVRHERGRLAFTYAKAWRSAPGAYPLSLSMPLAAASHPHASIEPFLWGLLPDNDLVLTRWAQRFQVSARNAFALIGHVGEDCAGAVQFVPPDRRDALINAPPAETQWLSDADVAKRLRGLLTDVSTGRMPEDTGQFSLAGAQPKTALLFDGQRWGVPSGRTPTTHILKPPTGSFAGFAENEHLCLALARALGLPTADSEVRQFEDVTAIVVRRYDRVRITDASAQSLQVLALQAAAKTASVYRVHQEDFCQALRVHPSLKYQSDGGPGPKQIVGLLRANASDQRTKERGAPSAADEDIATLVDALILNWLIGGTDAHAKNYSILIGGGGLVRLAPLYDVASILAYPDIDPQKAKLAMKIGNSYRLRDIGLSQWRKLSAELHLDGDAVVARVQAMAAELPDQLADVVSSMHGAGLTHPVISKLVEVLMARAGQVRAM